MFDQKSCFAAKLLETELLLHIQNVWTKVLFLNQNGLAKVFFCIPNVWTKVLPCTQNVNNSLSLHPNVWTKVLLCLVPKMFEQNSSFTSKFLNKRSCFACIMLEQKSCFTPTFLEQNACFAASKMLKQKSFYIFLTKILNKSLASHPECLN